MPDVRRGFGGEPGVEAHGGYGSARSRRCAFWTRAIWWIWTPWTRGSRGARPLSRAATRAARTNWSMRVIASGRAARRNYPPMQGGGDPHHVEAPQGVRWRPGVSTAQVPAGQRYPGDRGPGQTATVYLAVRPGLPGRRVARQAGQGPRLLPHAVRYVGPVGVRTRTAPPRPPSRARRPTCCRGRTRRSTAGRRRRACSTASRGCRPLTLHLCESQRRRAVEHLSGMIIGGLCLPRALHLTEGALVRHVAERLSCGRRPTGACTFSSSVLVSGTATLQGTEPLRSSRGTSSSSSASPSHRYLGVPMLRVMVSVPLRVRPGLIRNAKGKAAPANFSICAVNLANLCYKGNPRRRC